MQQSNDKWMNMVNIRLSLFKTLFLLLLFPFSGCTQVSMTEYIGEWKGEISNENAFVLDITIIEEGKNSLLVISNDRTITSKEFSFDGSINLTIKNNIVFNAEANDDKSEIVGFIQSNGYYYPVRLQKIGADYKGQWNLSAFQYLQSESLYLTIKKGNSPGDQFTAYPILGSLWCNNFKKEKDSLSFTDFSTGLNFKGILGKSEIKLKAYLGNQELGEILYKRVKEGEKAENIQYQKTEDGWDFVDKPLSLPKLEQDILSDTLIGTESVLIAKNGKILYESYFSGFTLATPHEMRSASKSISSAIIGITIDDGIIENVGEPLYDYIPKEYQYTADSMKSRIRLSDLLTMRSGIGVSEGTYQESNNWLKTVLEPSLSHKPNTVTIYKSADPYLTGIYLSERLETPLELYMEDRLFSPLGIRNYIMNADDTKKRPYFGGGLHLTPRDMLKFGQLYLNKGSWNGKRIISEKWVEESFKKHTRLEDVADKNEYGYFWWHNTYEVDGTKIESIEARGAGGQYIFVMPAINAVVVITSGNYRNGKTRQPEKILEEYILKSIL